MKTKLAGLRLAVYLAAYAGISLSARAVESTQILVTESKNYFYFAGPPISLTSAGAAIQGTGNVAAAFSALGDTSIVVEAVAPRGKLLLFDAPANYTTTFNIDSRTAGADSSGAVAVNATVQFIRPGRDVPALGMPNAGLSTAPSGYFVTLNQSLASGQLFTCKGIRITIPVPASYNLDVDLPAVTTISGSASALSEEADPGQYVRLIDDPLFLSLQKQIRSLKAKIRKARRDDNPKLAKRLTRKLKQVTKRYQSL